MSTLVAAAASDVDALATPHAAGPVQSLQNSGQVVASAPIVAALTDSSDAWKLLRDRLDMLMKLGDKIAQVHHVSPSIWLHHPYSSRPLRSIRMSAWHGE